MAAKWHLHGKDEVRRHVVVFFFSSRRRHTRFDCDWSSDVCSSDLVSALSWLALKARALRRYGPGFAVEVVIFWVMLEGFQQLNYGGRIITGPQSDRNSVV